VTATIKIILLGTSLEQLLVLLFNFKLIAALSSPVVKLNFLIIRSTV
jgi:hypothetical protein